MTQPIRSTQLKLPTLRGIERAAKTLQPYLPESPLIHSDVLSKALDADVWIKNEGAASPVASFKLRGALNATLEAKEQGTIAGTATSSSGNHGQGVAYASRLLGLPSHIFLPEQANPLKEAMIRLFGGTVHKGGKDIDAAKAIARDFAARNNMAMIDDGENLALMEGAGTVGLEVARRLPNVDMMIVPMGAGALTCGSATALKGKQPQAKVMAVQPEGSPAMVESFHAGKPVERPINTIADGTVCRIPAELALKAMRKVVDDTALVSEAEILSATRTLIESCHTLVEPSAATALAAAWKNREKLRGKRLVLVLTGANITNEQLHQALKAKPLFPLQGETGQVTRFKGKNPFQASATS